MISYEEAKKILRAAGSGIVPAVESIPVTKAVGRICAEDVNAPIVLQPFDNSAMDGYAVHLSDLASASPDKPVSLKILETIGAGNRASSAAHIPGTCVAIMTGAAIPAWTQAIIPMELAGPENQNIVLFSHVPSLGEHIRRAGQDFKAGDPVLRAGTQLGTQHLMALTALGIESIPVCRPLKACFFATGWELTPPSREALEPEKIYDSNSPYAATTLAIMGVECAKAQIVGDDKQLFLRSIADAVADGYDMILSSGGVSAGRFDFVRASLEDLGAEILFHKVAIKPGKPVLLARLPGGAFYFGLPGNPAAVAASLRFFVQPFLNAWRKLPEEQPTVAAIESTFRKNNRLRVFLKAQLRVDTSGNLHVSVLNGQESFMISPFLSMNAWIALGENTQEAGKGTLVDVYPLLQKDFCF